MLQKKKGQLENFLKNLQYEMKTIILFESPKRIERLVQMIVKILGPKRKVSLAKELTKKFERVITDEAKEIHELIIKDESLKKGEIIILDVWNDSRWPHSMHLHGNHFYVESKEFSGDDKLILRDTYLMQPGEKSKFIYLADNPGKWLFHCHMLEHAASGMIGYIEVV